MECASHHSYLKYLRTPTASQKVGSGHPLPLEEQQRQNTKDDRGCVRGWPCRDSPSSSTPTYATLRMPSTPTHETESHGMASYHIISYHIVVLGTCAWCKGRVYLLAPSTVSYRTCFPPTRRMYPDGFTPDLLHVANPLDSIRVTTLHYSFILCPQAMSPHGVDRVHHVHGVNTCVGCFYPRVLSQRAVHMRPSGKGGSRQVTEQRYHELEHNLCRVRDLNMRFFHSHVRKSSLRCLPECLLQLLLQCLQLFLLSD